MAWIGSTTAKPNGLNLKFLYEGPQKRRGNRRRYDGKVNLADPSRSHPNYQTLLNYGSIAA